MAVILKLVVLFGVVAAVLWAPIPLASNRPRFWFPLEGYVFFLFAIYSIAKLCESSEQIRGQNKNEKLIVWVCALWVGYQIAQMVPLPVKFLEVLSPQAYFFAMLREDTQYSSISIDRYATLEELLKRLMYVVTFFMLTRLVTTREQVKAILFALILAGLVQCLYAFFDFSVSDIQYLTGTFTNRNHFALYIAVCLSLLLGFYRYSARTDQDTLLSAKNILIFGIAIVFVAALTFASSRGAVVSFTIALIICTFLLKDVSSDRTNIRIFSLVVIALIASSVWFGASDILQRFSLSLLKSDERILQWADSVRLGFDYWLVGSGSGTYQYAFTPYKNEVYRPLFYNHAHNDYIELFCNEGIIGLLLFLVIGLIAIRRLLNGFRTRRDPLIKSIAFGSILATLTILIHGMFDYNLQVPANALLLFATMALGLATVNIKHKRKKGPAACKT